MQKSEPLHSEKAYLPPRDLEQLRALFLQIKIGEAGVRCGNRAKKTLAYMLDNPNQAAVCSTTQLADINNVNPSTLTRLSQNLGFKGFSGLQQIFQKSLISPDRFYSQQAGRLFKNDEADSAEQIFTQISGDEIKNINQMMSAANFKTLNEASELLKCASQVRVHASRQTFSVASFFSYGLGLLRPHVAVLGSPEHGVAHGLAELTKDDVLVVIGISPYTKATISAARIASTHSIKVIAITDSYASPLAKGATHTFITPSQGLFFSSSMAATLVLIEGLLTLVAMKMGNKAIQALEHHESLINELNLKI